MSTTPGMRCCDMTVTTTVCCWGAILLGGIFALGTAYVLFAHVHILADITTDHVMTGLVLVGTIAAGHMFWPAATGGRVLAALGLAILFVSGTFICVTGSAGRSAELSQKKEAEDNKVNGGLSRTVRNGFRRRNRGNCGPRLHPPQPPAGTTVARGENVAGL